MPRPWDSPGKNIRVGCHFLLQCMKVKSESEVAQSCPTLSDPMDYSLPGSSIHGIFQARVLELGAIAFSVICSLESPFKFSFAFATLLFGIRHLAFSLSWLTAFFLSKLEWVSEVAQSCSTLWVRDVWLSFTWTLKEYCRSIYWPNFNIVVSQGMGEGHTIGIEMREQLVGEAVRIHTTFIKFSVLRKLGSWAPKQL